MDLEAEKNFFKNHIATFTDYGNIKILDFKNPNSYDYRIRFLFEEDYYRLHISGDLGELIATDYNMTYERFSDFVDDTDSFKYIIFKNIIDCHSKKIYVYDKDLACDELMEMAKEHEWLLHSDKYRYENDEDERLNNIINDILYDFDEGKGIGSRGYDELNDLENDIFKFVKSIGKKDTKILELYMLAFKLAKEQIDKQLN